MNDPINLPPPAFTPEQLAERWACKPDAIRRLIRKGKLRGFKVGQQVRIPRAAIAEYERQGEPCEQGSTEDTGAPSGRSAGAPDANPCTPESGSRLIDALQRVVATRGLPARAVAEDTGALPEKKTDDMRVVRWPDK